MVFTDFLQKTDDGDLNFLYGDLITGPSDQQHVTDIIVSYPGWWKEFPQLGVGLWSYFNSAGQEQAIVSSMTVQLTSDGYSSRPIAIYKPDGTYTIHPNAERAEQ